MKETIVIVLSFFYLLQQDAVIKPWLEQVHRYDTRIEVYQYNQNYFVPYVQVENMKHTNLENEINELLKENGYKWMERHRVEDDIKNRFLKYTPQKPEITFQTGRYLSIKYRYDFKDEFIEKYEKSEYNNCITIDMKTGKRVKLKELLKLNSSLIERIKETKALIATEMDFAMNVEELAEFILDYESESLLEGLKVLAEDDNMTEEECITQYDSSDLNFMLSKFSYNLTWQGIEMNGLFGIKHLVIDKNYIKDFLNFDPWKLDIPIFFSR